MDRIFIHDLEVRCIIGIHDWEREIPQTVSIDLEIATDVARAAQSDAIEDATDYKAISKRIIARASESSFALIESLAEEIARICLQEHGTPWVRVRASKPGAIRGSRDVGVEVVRGHDPTAPGGERLVYLGIGSNIDPERNVVAAVDWLRRRFAVVAVSSVYQSPARGGSAGQEDFLNLVVCVRTDRDPFAVDAETHAIERRLGRERGADRCAPRTCDIDLLLHGGLGGEVDGLRLPHPQVYSEAFVLVPLLEIAPDITCPRRGRRLAELVDGLEGVGELVRRDDVIVSSS